MKSTIFALLFSIIANYQLFPQLNALAKEEVKTIQIGKDKVKALIKTTKKTKLGLKDTPKENAKIISFVPDNALVDVINVSPKENITDAVNWFKIKYQKQVGWIDGANLNFNFSKTTKPQIKYGFFEAIEWGDYCHLKIKNEKGNEESYWIFSTDVEKLKPIDINNETSYKKFKGKKIKLEIIENIQWIHECNCLYFLEDVKSLKIIN